MEDCSTDERLQQETFVVRQSYRSRSCICCRSDCTPYNSNTMYHRKQV